MEIPVGLEERFFARVLAVPGALPGSCWSWLGPPTRDGYGQLWVAGRAMRAHVVGWSLARGEMAPAGLRFRHLCGNRRCVNPEHVRPLGRAFVGDWCATHSECPRGHRLTNRNRVLVGGVVACRACRHEDEQARSRRRVSNPA